MSGMAIDVILVSAKSGVPPAKILKYRTFTLPDKSDVPPICQLLEFSQLEIDIAEKHQVPAKRTLASTFIVSFKEIAETFKVKSIMIQVPISPRLLGANHRFTDVNLSVIIILSKQRKQ